LTYDDNLFNVVKNETIDMNYIKIDSNISDLARDRVHYGINIQKQVKSIILEKLTE